MFGFILRREVEVEVVAREKKGHINNRHKSNC